MNTGTYDISKISCIGCYKTFNKDPHILSDVPTIGWIYLTSRNSDNLWKVGKYILEVKFIEKENWVEKVQDA
jgi:hypothetical protein